MMSAMVTAGLDGGYPTNPQLALPRSLELAIKDAAKKAAAHAGPGVSAASVDAQIRQARFDRFLSRVFAEGERSEWLL